MSSQKCMNGVIAKVAFIGVKPYIHPSMKQRNVVTNFLLRRNQILLLKRSKKVGTYQESWASISGSIEENDENSLQRATKEIIEETSLNPRDFQLLRKGVSLKIKAKDLKIVWNVEPFLWKVSEDAKIEIDWEHTTFKWIDPEEIKEYQTVPRLLETLQRVLYPEKVEQGLTELQKDRSLGANEMLKKSLELLKLDLNGSKFDGFVGFKSYLVGLILQIQQVRPSMSSNLVNRASKCLSMLKQGDTMQATIDQWIQFLNKEIVSNPNEKIAEYFVKEFKTKPILFTMSHSSTVQTCLMKLAEKFENMKLIIAESRPLNEGINLAKSLSHLYQIEIITDASSLYHIEKQQVTHCIFGADKLTLNHAVNKMGSGLVSSAVQSLSNKPFVWILSQTDKLDDINVEEEMEGMELGHSFKDVHVRNVYFEPVKHVDLYITELGVMKDLKPLAQEVLQYREILYEPL